MILCWVGIKKRRCAGNKSKKKIFLFRSLFKNPTLSESYKTQALFFNLLYYQQSSVMNLPKGKFDQSNLYASQRQPLFFSERNEQSIIITHLTAFKDTIIKKFEQLKSFFEPAKQDIKDIKQKMEQCEKTMKQVEKKVESIQGKCNDIIDSTHQYNQESIAKNQPLKNSFHILREYQLDQAQSYLDIYGGDTRGMDENNINLAEIDGQDPYDPYDPESLDLDPSLLLQSLKDKFKEMDLTFSKCELLYDFKTMPQINFHEKIDNKKNFFFLAQLQNKNYVGAFTHLGFDPKQSYIPKDNPKSFICNLTKNVFIYAYRINKTHTYDHNFLIFGNWQIKVKAGSDILETNWGCKADCFMRSFYGKQEKTKVQLEWLFGNGASEKWLKMKRYQMFAFQ